MRPPTDETCDSSLFRHAASGDRALARLARDQHGVVARSQLAAIGLTHDAVAYRLRIGRLHRLHRGVYAVGWRPATMESRFLAAVLACGPGAVLSHAAAGALWRIVSAPRGGPVDVTVTRQVRPRPGIRPHVTRDLGEEDLTAHWGIPVTTPTRTLLDLATVLEPRRLERAVGQAQVERLTSHERIEAAIVVHPRHRGATRLAAVVAGGPSRTRSELEDAFVRFLDRHGIPRPPLNHDLRIGGRPTEVDAYWPHAGVAVELDSARFHDPLEVRRRDTAKQARIESAGLRVVRITHAQLERAPAQTLRRLRAAL